MDTIEIFVGTYEEFILGFKIEQLDKQENKYALNQSLTSRDHSASVRCIASVGNYVATGGADDRAIIYDIEKRSLSHIMINHNGTINTLAFSPDSTHLFVGSDDGSISVTRVGTWVTENIWKNAHKGSSVKHLTIHPSGKLALSIGNDLVLRTWNLIKGRQAYATNLKNKASLGKIVETVEWSPNGKNFIISGARAVECWSVDEAKVISVVICKSKPCAICWINENDFLIGLESGDILYGNLFHSDTIGIKLFNSRIKGFSMLGDYLGVITSLGEVAICKITGKSIDKICSTNIGCRPTCITLVRNVYTPEPENKEGSKLEREEIVKGEKVKPFAKPKVIVEVETDDVDINKVDMQITPKKRQEKIKFDTNEIVPRESKKRTMNEIDNEEIDQKDISNCTSSKKSKKKKKQSQSLMIEPEINGDKLSKKQKRKSVV